MAKLLKTLVPTLINTEHSWQLTLLSNWHTILGNLNTKVTLEKITNDTIVLGVYDACWMQELYLLSPLLLSTINENLDQPRIKHLRFKRVVAYKKKDPIQSAQEQTPAPRILTKREQHALHAIEDPQLKDALHQFLIRCYKEKS